MSYDIYAVICTKTVAGEFLKGIANAKWEGLDYYIGDKEPNNQLILIPSTYAITDKECLSNPRASVDGFMGLDISEYNLMKKASKKGKIAYIMADFFGGCGDQGSLVFENEQVIYSAEMGAESYNINTALKHLGVEALNGKDAFDTIGLGKHRTTGQWGTSNLLTF